MTTTEFKYSEAFVREVELTVHARGYREGLERAAQIASQRAPDGIAMNTHMKIAARAIARAIRTEAARTGEEPR